MITRSTILLFAVGVSTWSCSQDETLLIDGEILGIATTGPGFFFYPPFGEMTTVPESWESNAYPFLTLVISEVDASGNVTRVMRELSRTTSPRLVRHDPSEAYGIGWDASNDTFVDGMSYRIAVFAQGRELGRSDIETKYVPNLRRRTTFWIKFRVEQLATDGDHDGVYDWVDHCPNFSDPTNPAPAPESCDDADNDCNGAVDDGNPGGGLSCSTGRLGLCGPGTTSCSDGAVVCVGNAGARAEICGNGLDEDCNGAIDNGCATCSDGAQNQGEAGIDCGGPCMTACVFTGMNIASVTHSPINGEGNRDGNSYPVSNLFDGNLNTRSRYRTGGSLGFRIEVNLAQPRNVSGLRIHVPAGQNAGYGGIRISTSTGGAYTVRHLDTRLFGISGRFASSENIGGVAYGANVQGVQGTYDHLFVSPVPGVTRILIETGWNDEASDACYSMNEMMILGI